VKYDPSGLGMTITAMAVVFTSLALLYLISKISVHSFPEEQIKFRPLKLVKKKQFQNRKIFRRSKCSHCHGAPLVPVGNSRRGKHGAYHQKSFPYLFSLEFENLHITKISALITAS
jgi:hypothetical protein